MNNSVNPEIEQAIGPIIRSLAARAIVLVDSHVSNSFGNFVASFRGAGKEFQIVRDRGQLIISGPNQQELEQVGLWRAFSGFRELEPSLTQWLNRSEA